MKTTVRFALLMSILFCAAAVQGQDPSDERPYVGILLEPLPAREVFAEHLGLAADQGLLIRNIQTGSPADKAGLERNDILIAFNGKPLRDPDQFIEAVQETGLGKEVSLEIIHGGQRKEVVVKAEPFKETDEWKYPFNERETPGFLQGRALYRLGPGEQVWREFLPGGPVREYYYYQYSENGDRMSVAIEGSPRDVNTRVIVRAGDERNESTIARINELPKPFVPRAKESIENAKGVSAAAKERMDIVKPGFPLPQEFKSLPNVPSELPLIITPKERDRMQRQMDELEKRLQRLEQERQEPRD